MAGKFTCWEDLTGRLLQVSRRGVPIWLLSTRPWVPEERSHPKGKQVRVKSAIVVRNELRPHCIESAGAPVHVARLQLFAPSSRLPELELPVELRMRQSPTIAGHDTYLVNWRPLEIFLYDWWPLVRRRDLYLRLAAAAVGRSGTLRPRLARDGRTGCQSRGADPRHVGRSI